jgi:hypothetical protein
VGRAALNTKIRQPAHAPKGAFVCSFGSTSVLEDKQEVRNIVTQPADTRYCMQFVKLSLKFLGIYRAVTACGQLCGVSIIDWHYNN